MMKSKIKTEFKGQKINDEMREVLRQGLEVGAQIVAGQATLNCPVDTGNLRSSITYQVDSNALEATIGTNVEYAPFVEFGTSNTPEQSFLRSAVGQKEQDVKKMFARYVTSVVDKR